MLESNEILSKIYEKVDREIPKDVKELLASKRVRKEMHQKYGNKSFLDSENLKFPVINPKTGNIDCKLIYAAIARSSIFSNKGGSSLNPKSYYDKIKEKASRLYKSNSCGEKIKAKTNNENTQEEIDILLLSDIFDIVESEYDIILNKSNYIEN